MRRVLGRAIHIGDQVLSVGVTMYGIYRLYSLIYRIGQAVSPGKGAISPRGTISAHRAGNGRVGCWGRK